MPRFMSRLIDAADASVDAPTVLGAGTLASHIGMTAYDLARNGHFDPQAFATGAAAIIAALAAAGWLHKRRDPDAVIPAGEGRARDA